MKKIFWQTYGLQHPHSGIGRHGYELARALKHMGQVPYALGTQSSFLKNDFSFLNPTSKLVSCSTLQGCRKLKPSSESVVHGLSNFNVPNFKKAKKVLTVHDLIPLISPHSVSRSYHTQMKYFIPRAIKLADKVICVSKWTKKTCEQLFPNEKEKLIHIPNGIEVNHHSQKVEFTRPILLCISRYEHYKRFGLMKSIIDHLSSEYRVEWVTDDVGFEWLKKRASHLITSGKLIVHTKLSSQELDRLCARSTALVHTSQFEGFCLPASEMISIGKPVVYLSGSGIDEVVGCAGIGLDTEVPDQWIEAIGLLHDNYSEWVQAVRRRSKKYETWREVAEKTLLVYN